MTIIYCILLTDLGNGDVGLTQFYSNGNTVTGKVELDLNSPEPDPSLYGEWLFEKFIAFLFYIILYCIYD